MTWNILSWRWKAAVEYISITRFKRIRSPLLRGNTRKMLLSLHIPDFTSRYTEYLRIFPCGR